MGAGGGFLGEISDLTGASAFFASANARSSIASALHHLSDAPRRTSITRASPRSARAITHFPRLGRKPALHADRSPVSADQFVLVLEVERARAPSAVRTVVRTVAARSAKSLCARAASAILARSRAVERCPARSWPQALTNRVRLRPNAAARRFIIAANRASVPPTCSASARQASLADWITAAARRSRTCIRSPGLEADPGPGLTLGAGSDRCDLVEPSAFEDEKSSHDLRETGGRERPVGFLAQRGLPFTVTRYAAAFWGKRDPEPLPPRPTRERRKR